MSGLNSPSSATSSTEPPGTLATKEQLTEGHSDHSTQKNNPKSLVCSRCGSKVLLPETATHVRKNVFLPLMTFKAAIPAIDKSTGQIPAAGTTDQQPEALHVLPDVPGEVLTDFWLVTDMYTFENVGVSHTVGTLKYLTCADCEIGPIGYQDLQQKDEFLVAWNRVEEK